MPKKIKNSNFWESAYRNKESYITYFNLLLEISISMFKWKNLPSTIDERYLELKLASDNYVVFFQDEVLGYLALQCDACGSYNVYEIPTTRVAYAPNGYYNTLSEDNSVLIYNNLLHTNSLFWLEEYAKRLYNIDRAIDVNVNAQKTPILISCDQNQALTLKNLYMQYDGNMPVIFGDKNINPNILQAITTGAPYVADRLYQLKTQIWNEALTYIGIPNLNITKKERLITDEVAHLQGGTIACRNSRLTARRQACRQINDMFGLEIWVDYRYEDDDDWIRSLAG